MKINPNWSFSRKEVSRAEQASAQQVKQKNFSDTMQQQEEKGSKEHLNRILQQIEKQGDRLSKTMTLRELRSYKLLVRQFLEEAIRKGVGLKETKGWDRRGRGRRYKILDEIDKQLLDMADDLIANEQGKIQILNGIGEIRGMLINLLF